MLGRGCLVVVSLSTVALGGPEDARFRRLSSLDDAQGLSKIIAKSIRCTVCEAASLKLHSIVTDRKFKNEENLLDEVSAFCEGGEQSSQGTVDFGDRLQKENWTVQEQDKGWALEPPADGNKDFFHSEEDEADKNKGPKDEFAMLSKKETTDLWGGFAKREGIKQACMLSVSEHQSELSEWLFMKVKKGKDKIPNAKEISTKLCHDLSSACKKKGEKKKTKKKKKDEM
eukprot:gnl/MRDRNA2_/MRDRNA2_106449_c0_seq1.p1 gnl/MRDRNA2_/MRDRNA2_106449_c0~~gnl/MRDRNA2_/MRDRNA2_106449_c0_seq1.p1  ORF type:complete len:228 (+),score=70.95 gnl/MRDRNA2_/MRDRNA2_106449_c0_seq1:62-745(+)